MLIKPGVDISRLNRGIRRALNIVNDVFYNRGLEAVITSTYEGNHSPGSLHYANDAFDVRWPGDNFKGLDSEIRVRLGNAFDVVMERDHIHIEHDPK